MGLVDSWLEGIGLGYAVPIFAGQGINSPDMLSELDVVDFPELGITDQNDRKKVQFFSMCSLSTCLNPTGLQNRHNLVSGLLRCSVACSLYVFLRPQSEKIPQPCAPSFATSSAPDREGGIPLY